MSTSVSSVCKRCEGGYAKEYKRVWRKGYLRKGICERVCMRGYGGEGMR